MTKKRSGRAPIILLVATLLAGLAIHMDGSASTGLFDPVQKIGTSIPYYGYNSSLIFDVSQTDQAVTIKQYKVVIPSGWHIAANSVDPSNQVGCAALNSGNLSTSAERLGSILVTLHNDDTRGHSGPVPYGGFLWFLRYDDVTQTATMCGFGTTSSALIPAAQRTVMFQVDLKRNGDGSADMTWNFSAVPGAAPGSRSFFDNTYFAGKHTTILYSRIEFNTLTGANYNTDPSGAKTAVRFVWNPNTPGDYTFTGTYTPCGVGDPPDNCSSSASPVTRPSVIRITEYPVGYHPGPVITSPALWTIARGSAPIPVVWRQPGRVSPSDPIKGYIITLSADYVKDSTKTFYVVTNPSVTGVASPNPCGDDGSATECLFDLTLPYTSDTGKPIAPDNNYSMNIVTVFTDGHRSDGRCDNLTGVGADAPCPNGTVPYFTSAGISRTQFMYRVKDWPLVYREIKAAGTPQENQFPFTSIGWPRPGYGVWQVFVLLADLDKNQFQFITWKPAGVSYAGGGATVTGSNAAGGAIVFAQLSGAKHWTVDAAVTPVGAAGLWVLASSTNQFEDSYAFNMSKV